VCVCVCACVRACVRVCVCPCAANLYVVGPVMHHNGLIPCGAANGSTCVVETRQGQATLELALVANKRVAHAYT